MKNGNNNKIIVILGPTSSGKSDIAIRLAKKFNGEVISADSRQIYRGMDVGTGKIEADPSLPSGEMSRNRDREGKIFISQGIPHYGINIVGPKTNYNAAKFKKYADKIIADILKRGKLPIICGGTGFWIKAIVDNVNYPEVKPDWLLRNTLRNKSTAALFKTLKKLDPARAKTIDKNNPVRLIRAIEICQELGKVPFQNWTPDVHNGRRASKNTGHFSFFQIGISLSRDKLYRKIKKRLKKRFAGGMIEEVNKLHYQDKISWKRLESFGLGYRLIPRYLKDKIKNKEELFEKIFQAEKDYAKRQMTWFRKDKRIVWLEDYKDIKKEVVNFLKNLC